MIEIIDRLVAITQEFRRTDQGASDPQIVVAEAAICQDLMIFGVGVDDYVHMLEAEFGPIIREIPWLRFTDQTASFRGWGCLFLPLWLIWRVPVALIRRQPVIPRPDPRNFPERLTLARIAQVIERGFWSDLH